MVAPNYDSDTSSLSQHNIQPHDAATIESSLLEQ